MTNSSKQKSEVVLYNQLMKDFRIAERQKVMGRFKKTLWFIAILLLLFFALKFYSSLHPKYVTHQTAKGKPDADILGIARKGPEWIHGSHVQQMLETNPEKIKKMRITNVGKYHGLKIIKSELMYWPLLENAHVESLDIHGTHIEPEAWKWLQTIKNFDNDLDIQLTDQKLDDAFYDGLNKFFEEKKVDTVSLFIAGLDICRLKLNGDKINNLIIMKSGIVDPPIVARQKLKQRIGTMDAELINKKSSELWRNSYQSHLSIRLNIPNGNLTLEKLMDKCSKG